VVSGFDRLVFRGTLIPFVRKRSMHHWLSSVGVRLLFRVPPIAKARIAWL
jgi:hypothetical protein